MSTISTVGIYLTEDERKHLTRLCDELEAFEESALRNSEGPEAQTRAAERAALRKLMFLPAASALDFDRVHGVVATAVRDRTACVAGWDGFSPGSIDRMIEDIATRVANALGARRADRDDDVSTALPPADSPSSNQTRSPR